MPIGKKKEDVDLKPQVFLGTSSFRPNINVDLEVCACKWPESKTPLLKDHLLNLGVHEWTISSALGFCTCTWP